jgi:glycosyltransferase involved in cell wall biosynthesis
MMVRGRISVLHFSDTLVRSGVEEHVLTLLKGLDRKHFRLHLMCPPALLKQMRPDIPVGVKLIPLSFLGSGRWTAARRLCQVLRRYQVDILHSHMFQSSRTASPLGFLCRVPVVLETPHVREQWRKGWLKSSFVLDRLVGRFVHYYVAISQANAHYLTSQKRLPAEKIVVIRNGIDTTRFRPNRLPPDGMKQGLGFYDEDPLLLVLARLEPQKGHHVLLEALPSVLREFPRARLVCAGDGVLRAELAKQARNLGVEHSVRFVGYQTNPADWLALADLVVLPSYYEGLPITAIEALAATKAIVATAVDGTPEVVVNGKTGLTVPPGQSAPLAQAICRLLGDKGLRTALGSAGRQWVLENFSQEQQVSNTQGLYLYAMESYWRKRSPRTPFLSTTKVQAVEEGPPSPR